MMRWHVAKELNRDSCSAGATSLAARRQDLGAGGLLALAVLHSHGRHHGLNWLDRHPSHLPSVVSPGASPGGERRE